MIQTLEKSMLDPRFRKNAEAFGKLKAMPYLVGCEAAFHKELCRRALAKGQKVPFDVLREHDDLFREALVAGKVGVDAEEVRATVAELADALRACWGDYARQGRTAAEDVARIVAAYVARSRSN
ncbi:MAG: hypothetical protein AB1578_20650 [Thermodesulfobacteriota bacterium]